MIDIIQIITLIVALFAISRAILRWKEHKISQKEFILWFIIWAGISVIVFIPKMADKLSLLLGFDRGVDILTFLALLILFYSVFRIYVKLNTMDSEITKIVREIAIKNKKKK